MGVMLVLILQMLLSSSVNAQGCGTLFLSGGAQSGGYASGGDAKYIPTSTFAMDLDVSWNMVSVPLIVTDYSKDALFPTAVSSAFGYSGSYQIYDTLIPNKGYWLKFDSAQSVNISGYDIMSGSVAVELGWNMIGSISVPIPASSITSNPPGIVTSEFFGYNGSYYGADTLLPGKGFWVRVSTPGVLNLSAALLPEVLVKNAIRIVHTNEMPPPPPDGSTAMERTIPKEYGLAQAYPNPFNPTTIINYQLPTDNWVTIKVYNVLGEEVTTLVDERQDAGYKSVKWNASSIPSGMYFYRMTVGSFVDVKKMLLLK